MASRDHNPPRVAGDHEGAGEQPGPTSVDDDADKAKHELQETSRLAEEYLASAARLAKDFLTESGPGAEWIQAKSNWPPPNR